jgi:hypothetical protein
MIENPSTLRSELMINTAEIKIVLIIINGRVFLKPKDEKENNNNMI